MESSPIEEAIKSVGPDKLNDLMAVEDFEDVPVFPDEESDDQDLVPAKRGRKIKPKLDSKSLTVLLSNDTIKKIRMIAIYNDRTIRDEVENMIGQYYESVKTELFK